MGHFPSGSSLKSLEHFAQITVEQKFQRFDYGDEKNMQVYNQQFPPEYNITQIHGAKIIHLVGALDRLSPIEDNMWLRDQLKDNIIYFKVYPIGHMSFLLARNMSFLYDTLAVIEQYSHDL